jgi:hypothetical protein
MLKGKSFWWAWLPVVTSSPPYIACTWCMSHPWHSIHPYMAVTQCVSPSPTFQPPLYGLYLAHVPMPGVYLAFIEPGIVIQGKVNNVFYIPAMYIRCMLANCHVPCTWPCMRPTFLPMTRSSNLQVQVPGLHRKLYMTSLCTYKCWIWKVQGLVQMRQSHARAWLMHHTGARTHIHVQLPV